MGGSVRSAGRSVEVQTTTTHPVDGGYSWVMAGVCCLIAVFLGDNYGSVGVFMVECKERFGLSTTLLTYIGALRVSLVGLFGVTVGEILQYHSGQRVLTAGILLIFVGHCSCGLLPQLGFWWLLVTYGIIPGLGYCCLVVIQASAFQEYFNRRRGVASALVYAGQSAGVFIWAPLLEWLFSHYGWTGALLIDGALHLHGLALALLVIPAHQYYKYYKCHLTPELDDAATLQKEEEQRMDDRKRVYSTLDSVHNKEESKCVFQPLVSRDCPRPTLGQHCISLTPDRQITYSSSHIHRLLGENNKLSLTYGSTQHFSSSLMSLALDRQYSVSSRGLEVERHSETEQWHSGVKDGQQSGKHSCHTNKQNEETVESSPKAFNDLGDKGSLLCPDELDQTLQKSSHHPNQRTLHKMFSVPCYALKRAVDFSLLKEIPFLLYCIGLSLAHLGHTAPIALVTVRAVEVGLDKTVAAFLISIFGICCGLSTPLWGIVADMELLASVRPVLVGLAAVVSGFISFMFFQVKDRTGFLVYTAVWGIVSGGYNLQSMMVPQLLGVQKVAKGAGTMYSLIGVSWVMTYILSGIFIDAFGNTAQPFFVLGAVELLGGLVICTIPIVQRCMAIQNTGYPTGDEVTSYS